MRRLTERDEYGNADIIGVDSEDLQSHLEYDGLCLVTEALNKLAALEDAQDEGRLVVLPCAVGTPYYKVVHLPEFRFAPGVIHLFFGNAIDILRDQDEFGKTVFLSKEAAEARVTALKEGQA